MGNKASTEISTEDAARLAPVPHSKEEIPCGTLDKENHLSSPGVRLQRAKTFDLRNEPDDDDDDDDDSASWKKILRTNDDHEPEEKPSFRPLTRARTFDSRFDTLKAPHHLMSKASLLHRRYVNFNKPVHRVVDLDTANATLNKNDAHRATTMTNNNKKKEAVIVIDPFSTGIQLAQEVITRGYACICVYSDTLEVMKPLIGHVPKELSQAFIATFFYESFSLENDKPTSALDSILARLECLDLEIVAVLAGAETGVPLTDALSEKLNLLSNGSSGTEARRNKYAMGEKIRRAGLRAVKQCSATTWSQVEAFIELDLCPDPFEVRFICEYCDYLNLNI